MKLKTTLVFLLSLFSFYILEAQCDGADFVENNGIAILEMENKSLPSNWKKETSKSGYTGNAYIIWRGNNAFNSPGDVGLISYKVKINNPGKYRFIWRNNIGVIANTKPETEHNDSWLKINASDFYGQKGSSKIWPKGSGKFPNPEGGGGKGYFKVFCNSLSYNWKTVTSDNNGHNIYAQFNSAGVYTILVSGRSNGHIIDRMVLYKESQYSAAQAQDLSRSQTTCGGGGGTPPPPPPPDDGGNNNPPTVSITSPNDGQNFSVGSTVSVGISANDSDGSITKHQVYVNNSLVDTDGSNYTPHKITNISSGSYAIRVTVTDNDGATASNTVNITVGGGSPPPPPPPSGGDNNPPTVSITSPTNGQNFSVGTTVSVSVSASDTDGSVTKYQVYVNNKLVDTDGSNYTPHKIKDINAGSYEIRVTVTDNDGDSASDTINITAGNGTPPPPPTSNDINLVLVNSGTDSDIKALNNGSTISSGSNKNIRAEVSNNNVKSVAFELRGAKFRNHVENVKPYALFGDEGGDYKVGSFNAGSYTLTVKAYSGLNKSGSLLESRSVSFSVSNSGSGKSAIAYPNPVKQGPVSVKLPEEIQGEAAYAVISPSGTEVARGTIDSRSLGDNRSLQINTSTMKNDGVYYLVIQANYDVYTVPIIKQ